MPPSTRAAALQELLCLPSPMGAQGLRCPLLPPCRCCVSNSEQASPLLSPLSIIISRCARVGREAPAPSLPPSFHPFILLPEARGSPDVGRPEPGSSVSHDPAPTAARCPPPSFLLLPPPPPPPSPAQASQPRSAAAAAQEPGAGGRQAGKEKKKKGERRVTAPRLGAWDRPRTARGARRERREGPPRPRASHRGDAGDGCGAVEPRPADAGAAGMLSPRARS